MSLGSRSEAPDPTRAHSPLGPPFGPSRRSLPVALVLLSLVIVGVAGAHDGLVSAHPGTSAPSMAAGALVPSGAGDRRPLPTITHEGTPHFFPTPSSAQRTPTNAVGASPRSTVACGPYSTCGPLSYGGGPVMHSSTDYLIFWEPAGYTYDTGDPAALAASDAAYEGIAESWFQTVGNSPYMQVLQQYTDSAGAPGTAVTLGGAWVDTTPYPGGTGSSANPLQDSQVQSEVLADATAHGTPLNSNTEYFVLLPLNVYECFSGSCSFTQFCAYHDWFTSGANVGIYALMPDQGTSLSTCSVTGELQTTYPYGPNGDEYGDSLIPVLLHEFSESVTDPEYPNGWDSGTYGEVGDECAWAFGPMPYQDHPDLMDTGHPFTSQYMWDNANNDCWLPTLPGAPAPSVPTASVTYKSSVELGASDYINVSGTNGGVAGQSVNLTVEFPSNPPLSDLSVFSSSFPTAPVLVPAGSSVRGCYWLCSVATSYPQIDAQEKPGATGATPTLGIEFAPNALGTLTFYVKASAMALGSNYTSDWSPTSGTQDAQNEYVTAYSITVTAGPSVSQPTATPASIDTGETATFSTTLMSAGTAPDTYAWSASSPAFGCASSSTTTLPCTPTAAGTYKVTAEVKDAVGGRGLNTSANYVVLPAPSLTGPTVTPASADVGHTVSFQATLAQAGSGGDVYAWSVLPATGLGCTASATLAYSCLPSAAGWYNVSVQAIDTNGGKGVATLAYHVFALPKVAAPLPTPTSVDVGQSVLFRANLTSPGSGGDRFTWTSSSTSLGCSLTTNASIPCSPTAAGNYTVSVRVNDSNGGQANATSARYRVFPDPSVSAAVAVPKGPEVGISTNFTASLLVPGSGGDRYQWTTSPTTGLGCTASSNVWVICKPTLSGTYQLTVTVRDSNGGTGTATARGIVVTLPLIANGTVSPMTGAAPLSANFVGTVSGGTAPYTFTWHFGDGPTSLSPQQNTSHTYGSAGTYAVVLTVNDSLGHSAQKVFAVSVGPPSTFGFLGFLPGGLWSLLLLIVLVAVVALVLAVRHRRKKGSVAALAPSAYDQVAPGPVAGAAYDPSASAYSNYEPPPEGGWPDDPSTGGAYPTPPLPPADGQGGYAGAGPSPPMDAGYPYPPTMSTPMAPEGGVPAEPEVPPAPSDGTWTMPSPPAEQGRFPPEASEVQPGAPPGATQGPGSPSPPSADPYGLSPPPQGASPYAGTEGPSPYPAWGAPSGGAPPPTYPPPYGAAQGAPGSGPTPPAARRPWPPPPPDATGP